MAACVKRQQIYQWLRHTLMNVNTVYDLNTFVVILNFHFHLKFTLHLLNVDSSFKFLVGGLSQVEKLATLS